MNWDTDSFKRYYTDLYYYEVRRQRGEGHLKKLVQINSVCYGSTGRIAKSISDAARKEGYEVHNFYGRGKPFDETCTKISNTLETYISGINTRVFGMHAELSMAATNRLISEIERIKPDIIQIHNVHGYYVNKTMLFEYLKKQDCPVVWTMHDCWAFTGHCAYFDYPECDKWITGCGHCPRKNDYPRSLFFDTSRKEYRKKKEIFNGVKNMTLVTPSLWLKGLIGQSILKNYEVVCINNGVNVSNFKPTEDIDVYELFNIPGNKKIVLSIASVWERRKGLDDLMALADMLDDEYQLVTVGLNDAQLKKLNPKITGIKRTENVKQLARLYTQAYVLVNPTFEDNYPTVNLESICCGTPVITYNTGGSVEVINEHTGLVTQQNTPESLLKAIRELNIDSIPEEEMSRYSDSNMSRNYLELYESLLNR